MASLGLEMERGMLAKEEKKEEDEEEEEGGEASVTDEEEEEESDTEPERPPDAPRKVSFADAFGLDLVSVKEFDDFVVDPSGPGVNGRAEAAAEVTAPHARPRGQAAVENHLSCLFSVPAEPDELRRRLRRQKVELESVELLPGTATLRGVVRVANLCYRKAVYVRVSPDAWRSHFELPAVYVPGSSDRETDRFAFLYVLEPPAPPPAGAAGKTCTRLEFCLRYETEVGTFWANNGGLNFVLFCHRKGRGEEATRDADPKESEEEEEEEEDHLHRRRLRRSSKQQKGDKRSCLKANSEGEVRGPGPRTIEAEAFVVNEETSVVRRRRRRRRRLAVGVPMFGRTSSTEANPLQQRSQKSLWLQRATSISPPEQPAGDHHHHQPPPRRRQTVVARKRTAPAPAANPGNPRHVRPQRQLRRRLLPEGLPPVSISDEAQLANSQAESRDNVPLAPEGSSVTELATTTTTAVDNNGNADDSSRTQRPKCVPSETRRETRDTEGMRGEKGGGEGGDRGGAGGEPLSGPAAGASITSSGETPGTTEMTAAAAGSQNASNVDKISQGAPGPGERLRQSRGDDEDKDEAGDEEEKGEKEEEEVVVVVDMEEEEEEEEQGKAGSQCTTQKQGTDMQERRYRGHGTR
ncbi:hypothetical protein CRUP_011985 [Coryphaenoides rupestris]|nr:hypothetical protein CRUP_011985 [Coryphaenoides rupestris]